MKKHLKWMIPVACVLVLAVAATLFFLLRKPQPETTTEKSYTLKLAWNVDKAEYKDKERIKSENAYRISLIVDGKKENYYIEKKAVIENADTMVCFGIYVDEENNIDRICPIEDFTGGWGAYKMYVQSVSETEILCNSSDGFHGVPLTLRVDANTKYINADEDGGPMVGTEETPEAGDCIYAVRNKSGIATYVFLQPPFQASPVYWNVERMFDTTLNISTRQADALGRYTFKFAVDGDIVELQTKDMQVAADIDNFATRCMHLEFDEEGFITEASGAWNSTGTWTDISWCYITEISDTQLTAVKISGSKSTYYTAYFANKMKAFDVSGKFDAVGTPTELRVGDLIHCLGNRSGDLSVVFVVNRYLEKPIYWNVERMYDSAVGKTTRTKTNGYYVYTLAYKGKQVTLKTKDADIANQMDSYPAKCFGLDINGDLITAVYDPWKLQGGMTWGSWVDITSIKDGTASAVKYENGKITGEMTGVIASDIQVYNVSGIGAFVGEKTTLQVGDRVHALRDALNNIKYAFVVNRSADCKMYFNVQRQYDTKTKTTSREPDADGYYVFTMADNGTTKRLRTKDKALATKIDAIATRAMGLKLNGDVITAVYNDSSVKGFTGGRKAAWYTVTAIKGKTLTAENRNTGDVDYGWVYTGTMASNCEVFNVSETVEDHMGEKLSVSVGDKVLCLLSGDGKIVRVYLVSHTIDAKIYWNVDRMWDGEKSTRTPDGSGVYHITMAVDGKQVEVTTKNKEFVETIDGRPTYCVGLLLKGNEITKVLMPWKCRSTTGVFGSWSDVYSVSGGSVASRKVTPGEERWQTFTAKMASDCAVYNVSTTATAIGEKTTLQVGDRIHGLTDTKGQLKIIYVVNRLTAPIEQHASHCVCGGNTEAAAEHQKDGACKSVAYRAVRSGTELAIDLKYATGNTTRHTLNSSVVNVYLSADVQMMAPIVVEPGQTLNICLHGHKLTAEENKRLFNVFGTLNICDCKGGGTAVANETTAIYAFAGGKVNLYGGTVTTSVINPGQRWGVIYVGDDANETLGVAKQGAKLRIYGGIVDASALHFSQAYNKQSNLGGAIWCLGSGCSVELHGGTVKGANMDAPENGGYHAYGGAIAVTGSTNSFTMTGGTVTGGRTPNGLGGNLYLEGTANLLGGTVSGGVSSQGGNIYTSAKLTINGTTVTGGSVVGNVAGAKAEGGFGGNIYIAGGSVTVAGGTVEKGTATALYNSTSAKSGGKGGNIYLNAGTFSMTGGTVTAGKAVRTTVGTDGEGGIGGNFYFRSSAKREFTGGVVSDGESSAWAGNLYALGANTDVVIGGNARFEGGKSGDGGSIYVCNVNLILSGTSLVTGGKATGNGGNIYLSESGCVGNVYMKDTAQLTGGTADKSGGNIYINAGKLTMESGNVISGGVAKSVGGNIYNRSDANVTLTAGTVSGGTAIQGGNIYMTKSMTLGGSVKVKNGSATTSSGGNVYVCLNTLTVTGSAQITAGSANSRGGNIYVSDSGYTGYVVLKENASVTHGSAVVEGGNIYVRAGSVTMSGNVAVTDGSAATCGGVCLNTGATLNAADEGKISNNTNGNIKRY